MHKMSEALHDLASEAERTAERIDCEY
jgi:hypothetical protein